MKKLLVLLLVLCLVGMVNAEMGVDGTENFDATADGAMPAGWGGWGAGENYFGYFGTWQAWKPEAGGPSVPTVQGGAMVGNMHMNYFYPNTAMTNAWGYAMQFHHNTSMATIGSGAIGSADVTLSFDTMQSVATPGTTADSAVKIEFYWRTHDGSNTDKGLALISEVAFPVIYATTMTNFTVTVPAAAVPLNATHITPVLSCEWQSIDGGDATVIYDNVVLTSPVPEPITIGLLGLGGLFLRRRK